MLNSFEGGIEETLKEKDAEKICYSCKDGCMVYSSLNEGKFFGIVTKATTDGRVDDLENEIKVSNAKNTLILIKVFSKKANRKAACSKLLTTRCLFILYYRSSRK